MNNISAIARVSFAAILLFLGGCTTTRGQISDGRYISPLGNFTVPLPDGMGLRVQEKGEKDWGSVAFHDDFGSFKSIFYLHLSPESLKTQNDPIKQRAILVSFLNDFAMPSLFKPVSPSANILHREHVNVGDYNAYFAVVEIPDGSTMFDVRANKRYDTKRGLLIFVKGEFMYMLSQ